jgi:hypothetical protein
MRRLSAQLATTAVWVDPFAAVLWTAGGEVALSVADEA